MKGFHKGKENLAVKIKDFYEFEHLPVHFHMKNVFRGLFKQHLTAKDVPFKLEVTDDHYRVRNFNSE